MNPATTAGIANADAHLKDVGLPTYSELAGALRDLMNYTGEWDEKPSHPCGKAARVISRLEAAGKFLYQDPTAQDDTPTIDLMHVSCDRILDTYLKAYPGLPPELKANDIVGHVCELIERSATQALRDDGGTLEQQLAGVRPLSKEAALEKWDGFKDRAIEGGFGSQQERISGLIKAGATKDQLIRFWRETKHLSWAASFGQSPWETASSVGAALDAAHSGGAVSPYHRWLVYVFDRTIAAGKAEAVSVEQGDLPQGPQRRMRM